MRKWQCPPPAHTHTHTHTHTTHRHTNTHTICFRSNYHQGASRRSPKMGCCSHAFNPATTLGR
jgi:hypothetical protein